MKHVNGKITKDTKLLGRKEKLLEHMSGKILDIGCGEGELLIKALLLGHDITGLDRDMKEINTAMETAALSGVVPKIIKGEINNMPFDEEAFDTIIMGEVIEHLPNLVESIHTVMSFLKPGGKLLITTPSGFAHADNDHKNFFFPEKAMNLLDKYWVFDFLPTMWLKIHSIISIEYLLNQLGYEYKFKEIEYKNSTHQSLDLFIIIEKGASE